MTGTTPSGFYQSFSTQIHSMGSHQGDTSYCGKQKKEGGRRVPAEQKTFIDVLPWAHNRNRRT
jgi:hypothetical protein